MAPRKQGSVQALESLLAMHLPVSPSRGSLTLLPGLHFLVRGLLHVVGSQTACTLPAHNIDSLVLDVSLSEHVSRLGASF